MGLYFMDEQTNSRLLRTIIYPVIWMIWLIHQSEVIKEALVSEFNVYKNYSYSMVNLCLQTVKINYI